MEMDIEAVDSDGDRTIDPETDNGVIHSFIMMMLIFDYMLEWEGRRYRECGERLVFNIGSVIL